MKGFDVLKVKSAVKSRNKFDLSFSHLTTMDFGEIVPLFARELVPSDEFTVRGDYFSRMAPLVKPTYGKFQFKTVAGFVPYHQVAYDADAWISGKTSLEGQTTHSRFITVGDLWSFIETYCITTTGATSTNCNVSWKNSSGTVTYGLFTKQGKYWVKILNALGYACPQGVDLQTSSSWYTSVRSVKLSAYPLLAFFKLYNDYMSQSQRFNTSVVSDVLYRIKNGIAYSGMWTYTTGEILPGGINALFSNLFLNYENDYFTSAWQNPNAPLNSLESIGNGMNAPSRGSETISYNVGANELKTPVTSNYNYVSQRALDFLRDFDDWVRRNNYSGSRDVQQIYSRFGIKIEDYKTRYSHIINTDSLPIQVGDVTATADANSVPLGDYAGKGIMNGSKEVYYKSSDYGMLFIFGYFTVTPMNSYGYDRQVLRSEPLDYYTPEFDGLGGDAISLGEVYASPLAVVDSDTTLDTAVFGFTERYNSYRYGRDVITGEFRDYRNNGDMNTWHTGRNLSAIRKAGTLVAQSSAMNTLEQIDSQYNRIFSVTNGDVNHFYLTARFNVDAIRPMLNLNQVVRLGQGNTNVPRNGNVIN